MIGLEHTVAVKDGNVWLLALRDGALSAEEPHPLGLWLNDCRYLSAHELTLGGERPALVAASDEAGAEAVHELASADGGLHVRIVRRVEASGALRERIEVESRRAEPAAVPVELRLRADFLPMLELRGLVPARARDVETCRGGFSTLGRDGVRRSTRIRATPEPRSASDGELVFDLELEPGATAAIDLDVELVEAAAGAAQPPRPTHASRPIPAPPSVTTDSEDFDRALRRALSDLRVLRSELDGQPYYAAGIPWFVTLFGRDSLIAALQTLAFTPEVAEGTLRLLAARLGRRHDDARDEEPGKVVHELRVGEPAALGETPFARYHGSADGTPLFLCLLCGHASWTGSLRLFRELRKPVEAALGWLDREADLDGDGLLEYRRRAPGGLETQGWKDSPAGTPGDDGRPLAPPVALVEVQGYAIRARRELARLYELDGDPGTAARLTEAAARLETLLERFWLEDRGAYAIGLDGRKRPGTTVASNPAHLLWAGAADPNRARATRDLLMGPELFTGWGVRTLGPSNPAFNPLGYHTGSVWPHDTALAAAGLRRHGFDKDFARLFDGLLAAALTFESDRLPELFGGFAREDAEPPVPYPVACRPQAWAAGSVPFLLTSALGLRPDALRGRLDVVRPALPAGVNRLELSGLRAGAARLDLRFEREVGGARLTRAAYSGGSSSTKISNPCSGSKTIWL